MLCAGRSPTISPASRPGQRANSRPITNSPGYWVAPKVLLSPQKQQQQQACYRIKDKGNSVDSDKGSGDNYPGYENKFLSQLQSKSSF